MYMKLSSYKGQKSNVMQNANKDDSSQTSNSFRLVHGPSTPQKVNMFSGVRNTTDSLYYHVNKENSSSHRAKTEGDYMMLLEQNKKLNQFIQRQIKEKQDLEDQLISEMELQKVKDRIQNLEDVIDKQTLEIEEWKKKYQQASMSSMVRGIKKYKFVDQDMEIEKKNEENEKILNEYKERQKKLENKIQEQAQQLREKDDKIKQQSETEKLQRELIVEQRKQKIYLENQVKNYSEFTEMESQYLEAQQTIEKLNQKMKDFLAKKQEQ